MVEFRRAVYRIIDTYLVQVRFSAMKAGDEYRRVGDALAHKKSVMRFYESHETFHLSRAFSILVSAIRDSFTT